MPKGSFCTMLPPKSANAPHVHMSKVHDSLHLPRNQSTPKTTTMSKALHLPRSLHIEVKRLRSPAPGTKSRLGAWAQQFQRACAVEMHFHDLERLECAANSSEGCRAARCGVGRRRSRAPQLKRGCSMTSRIKLQCSLESPRHLQLFCYHPCP